MVKMNACPFKDRPCRLLYRFILILFLFCAILLPLTAKSVRAQEQAGKRAGAVLKKIDAPAERPDFFLQTGELPRTGITDPNGFTQTDSRPSGNAPSSDMELLLPTLDVISRILPAGSKDGFYPLQWLGMDAGLLEGTDLPGEGIAVIAAHNTVSAGEYGPFAQIFRMEEGDRFFVNSSEKGMLIYEVYLNWKIGSFERNALWTAASAHSNTLTLMTCEDELPDGGGYAARRIVSGRLVN